MSRAPIALLLRRALPVLSLAIVAACGGGGGGGSEPIGADLGIDADQLADSVLYTEETFPPEHCAVVEGAVEAPGTRRLLRFDTVIVNYGDVHVHFGAELKLDFENTASQTVGVEFTNSSITSGGDGSDVAATWDRLRSTNAHIKLHSNRRGYVSCTATPSTMRGEFKVVDRVSMPGAPVRSSGALVIEAGRPGATTD